MEVRIFAFVCQRAVEGSEGDAHSILSITGGLVRTNLSHRPSASEGVVSVDRRIPTQRRSKRLWAYYKLWPNLAFDVYPDQSDACVFQWCGHNRRLIMNMMGREQ
jgi:hypothetical protein